MANHVGAPSQELREQANVFAFLLRRLGADPRP